jgi:8-oxo-dGTP pyrophosphatase MutT (NUDIX family)
MVKRVRASAVCRHEDRLLVVRLRDPATGIEAVFPPGGAIEAGEMPSAAAIRETLEETGLRTRIDDTTARVETYPYRWSAEDYDVTTHFFEAELDEPFGFELPKVTDAPYHLGASWMPVSDALEAMPAVVAAPVAAMLRRQNHARWRCHPNISGPARTLLAIHDSFRAASRQLIELVAHGDDLRRIAWFFAPLGETLHHHHHAEETMLFPALGGATRLVEDHGALTRAIAELEVALASSDAPSTKAAAHAFDRVLVSHLDREEEVVVAWLLTMTPGEAWARIHG